MPSMYRKDQPTLTQSQLKGIIADQKKSKKVEIVEVLNYDLQADNSFNFAVKIKIKNPNPKTAKKHPDVLANYKFKVKSVEGFDVKKFRASLEK